MTIDKPYTVAMLGVILAGGMSSRMGGDDKFLLPLGDKIILQHIIDRLSPQVDKLILNANRYSSDVLEVVPDIISDVGPLGGLYTALSYAKKNGFERVLTVACDTPFIPEDLKDKFVAQSDSAIVVAKSQGRLHPVIGMWHVSLLDDLRTSIKNNERKMMFWVKKHDASNVSWDNSPDPFININTPNDLEEAEKLL